MKERRRAPARHLGAGGIARGQDPVIGVALVGEKIESERQVVDLLDFAIDFGQGYLFGEPRPPR